MKFKPGDRVRTYPADPTKWIEGIIVRFNDHYNQPVWEIQADMVGPNSTASLKMPTPIVESVIELIAPEETGTFGERVKYWRNL